MPVKETRLAFQIAVAAIVMAGWSGCGHAQEPATDCKPRHYADSQLGRVPIGVSSRQLHRYFPQARYCLGGDGKGCRIRDRDGVVYAIDSGWLVGKDIVPRTNSRLPFHIKPSDGVAEVVAKLDHYHVPHDPPYPAPHGTAHHATTLVTTNYCLAARPPGDYFRIQVGFDKNGRLVSYTEWTDST